MYKISVKTGFSAAHHLRDYKGNCENVHGHNWKIKVTAGYKELKEDGMAIDFRDLKKASDEAAGNLDHTDINRLDYFGKNNPTSENIARYIFEKVKKKGIPVISVEVAETDSYSAVYTEGQ